MSDQTLGNFEALNVCNAQPCGVNSSMWLRNNIFLLSDCTSALPAEQNDRHTPCCFISLAFPVPLSFYYLYIFLLFVFLRAYGAD